MFHNKMFLCNVYKKYINKKKPPYKKVVFNNIGIKLVIIPTISRSK